MDTKKKKEKALSPPSSSTGFLTDINYFILHKPEGPTLVKFQSETEKQEYSLRIMQRLGIETDKYSILNVHQIGINAPAKYVFEELLKWDGDSSCWPNYLAHVGRIEGQLENIQMFLFGIRKYPFGFKNSFLGIKYIPMFNLDELKFCRIPESADTDNARYLLFETSGGYPIGVFCMYVRSSISAQNEQEPAQLFFLAGFNFYGRNNWFLRTLINGPWEMIHDRVTANILNRIKLLCEWRFDKIQKG